MVWSSPDSSDFDCIEACRLANAAEFISKLPDGLDTVVGDRGGRLSGGQRQRLALARALIRRPEILVLDEATSSLDSESEMLIQAALDKLKGSITIIAVAHRLASVRNADYLYIFQSGEVVEAGRYDDLIRNSEGIFYDMVTRQSGVFINSE